MTRMRSPSFAGTGSCSISSPSLRDARRCVGWAEALLRRAHHPSSSTLPDGGHAFALPTLRIANCVAPRTSATSMRNCDKSTRRANHSKTCPALRAKIFRLTCRANQRHYSARLTQRGAIAIVTNVRWDAVDAECATDEWAYRVRRSRVVLTPRCWRQVPGKQASQERRWQKSRSPGRARSKP